MRSVWIIAGLLAGLGIAAMALAGWTAASVGGLLLLGAAVSVIAWRAAGRRRRAREAEFEAAARRLGLNPVGASDRVFLSRIRREPIFRDARARIQRVHTGQVHGRTLVVCEHESTVVVGTMPATVRRVVAVVHVPNDWPYLTIRPRVAGRLGAAMPWARGLPLEVTAFNRRYLLRSEVPDFAIALLGPELQRRLAAARPPGRWTIDDGRLALVEAGSLDAASLRRVHGRVAEFLTALPPELVEPTTFAPGPPISSGASAALEADYLT